MTTAPDAWDELNELAAVLDDFAETPPGEYFGVDAMRMSLEQRRSLLVETILSHHEPVPEQLDLVLTGETATGRGVRLNVLVALLNEVQEALAAIGTAISRGPRRVRVSAQMRELVAMRVSLALPGSLAVRLVPADEALTRTQIDLFGEHASLLEQSADRLVTFFRDVADSDTTSLDAVSEMGPSGADRIQRLARVVAESGTSTRLRWRSPRLDREAVLHPETAGRVHDFLATLDVSEHRVTYDGQLVGGSLPRGRFELELPDGQVITGSVEKGVLPLLENFSFGEPCRAEIVVAVVATPAGLKRQSHTLVGLTNLGGKSETDRTGS